MGSLRRSATQGQRERQRHHALPKRASLASAANQRTSNATPPGRSGERCQPPENLSSGRLPHRCHCVIRASSDRAGRARRKRLTDCVAAERLRCQLSHHLHRGDLVDGIEVLPLVCAVSRPAPSRCPVDVGCRRARRRPSPACPRRRCPPRPVHHRRRPGPNRCMSWRCRPQSWRVIVNDAVNSEALPHPGAIVIVLTVVRGTSVD